MLKLSRSLCAHRLIHAMSVAALSVLFIPWHPATAAGATLHHYKYVDIGTFGGPNVSLPIEPRAQLLNDRGVVVGQADTPTPNPYYPNDNQTFFGVDANVAHALQWRQGVLTDLGTLPGGVDSLAVWINQSGVVGGLSEDGEIDPLLGVPRSTAVLWVDGKILSLGTLDGGYESAVNSINDHGQAVGVASNGVLDPYSMLSLVTQTRSFLWENGQMRDLGTLGGPDAFALYVNEAGQVAGSSYTNATANATTGVPTVDPFLWEHGVMHDLGTLGGVSGAAYALNDAGEVAGQSNLAGDVIYHAFLWTKAGGMRDLGTLGGNYSTASWINNAGEIVGWATTAGDQTYHAVRWTNGGVTDLGALEALPCGSAYTNNSDGQVVGELDDCVGGPLHAALYQDGQAIDLNRLIPAGSGVLLYEAAFINDRGEIVGNATVVSTGDNHAFLLIPCDDNHPNVAGCDYGLVEAAKQ
jgi:probable HAF family extracellular repeat protein